eukprot:CAMPEP_0197520132 /NCGR_PEP_ID=MMETSP1318-20131121/5437_1 /TAXON_ID=552666 /ORGANISM="Partenskyella glossopodia, Strain RCC365" /LENGTH=408 /DNA_ID=CAMNT_0043071515 /DNA_START=471 /DNA_END=1697 /DNA_ORIENTATION=+
MSRRFSFSGHSSLDLAHSPKTDILRMQPEELRIISKFVGKYNSAKEAWKVIDRTKKGYANKRDFDIALLSVIGRVESNMWTVVNIKKKDTITFKDFKELYSSWMRIDFTKVDDHQIEEDPTELPTNLIHHLSPRELSDFSTIATGSINEASIDEAGNNEASVYEEKVSIETPIEDASLLKTPTQDVDKASVASSILSEATLHTLQHKTQQLSDVMLEMQVIEQAALDANAELANALSRESVFKKENQRLKEELESVKDKLVDCQKHVEGLNTEIHDLLRANLGHSRGDVEVVAVIDGDDVERGGEKIQNNITAIDHDGTSFRNYRDNDDDDSKTGRNSQNSSNNIANDGEKQMMKKSKGVPITEGTDRRIGKKVDCATMTSTRTTTSKSSGRGGARGPYPGCLKCVIL